MKNKNIAAWAEFQAENWALDSSMHEALAAIADGDFSAGETADTEALAEVGERVLETRYSFVAGDTGILQVTGPLMSRAGFLSRLLGWAATDELMSEFKALEDDPSVKRIVLVFDTPGGAVTGTSEFASMLAGCDKETTAYVYGTAASAGYWLAAGCDKIVSSDTGRVGSIGVVMSLRTQKSEGRIEIVNSKSPNKRLDPGSKAGRDQLESLLDQTAEVFMSFVAQGRGVSLETVESDFGKGGVVGARLALEKGMIDQISTLKGFMTSLKESNNSVVAMDAAPQQRSIKEMPTLQDLLAENPGLQTEIDALTAAARDEGVSAEKAKAKANYDGAVKVLKSDSYPAPLREMAAQVMTGEMDLAALTGAVAAFDATIAAQKQTDAVKDSAEIEPTPAADPGTPKLSTDGILRSSVDIDTELAALRRN